MNNFVRLQYKGLQPYIDPALAFLLRRLQQHHAPSFLQTMTCSHLAVFFADSTGMDKQEKKQFVRSALAHDLGIVHVKATHIQLASVDHEAKQAYQLHPEYSVNIIREFGLKNVCEETVRYHHENLDGNGYPYRLSWHDLSYEVRVLRVLDAFAALACDKTSRAHSIETMLEKLYLGSDVIYDKEIVEHFSTMIRTAIDAKRSKK